MSHTKLSIFQQKDGIEFPELLNGFKSDRLPYFLLQDWGGKKLLTLPIYVKKIKQKLLTREKKLRYHALHDTLTGLPNRTWLIKKLQFMIKSETNQMYAVLLIGLNRFKVINNYLGYLAGDELLKSLALRLQNYLGNAGKVVRFSGDEFIVVLENIHSFENATLVAETIQKEMRLPFDINGKQVFIEVSIGISFSSLEYCSAMEILRDVGIALSEAKRAGAGKGRYEVLTAEIRTKAMARLQLENDLRQAIGKNQLYLEYQPIYCLATGDLKGFEALVRWHHPSRGILSPVEFIPIAEEIGLIENLDFWVLQEAIRQLKKWQLEFPNRRHLVMNINFSIKQLRQVNLLQQIDSLCSQMQLSGDCLKLEITETCFQEISSEDIRVLKQIREKGIGLCIDDFGTGYSSLSRLYEFPVDTLKVDRSFVKRLGSSEREIKIMQTIFNLARSFGLNLVAEGIETSEQLKALQELGYEFGQGFLFSKPLSCQMAMNLLRA